MESKTPFIPLWEDMQYYKHQLVGIKWMLKREIKGVTVETEFGKTKVHGGLQCDDMGLGKTIQTMAVIKNNLVDRTLIIAPLAMLETWQNIAKKSGFKVFTVQSKEWTTLSGSHGKQSIYIAGYERLVASPSLTYGGFDRIILDEAHKIKNVDGSTAKVIRRIEAQYRWALTGTPIVNKKKDLVSLFKFIGIKTGFQNQWDSAYNIIVEKLVIHRSMDSIRKIVDDAPLVPIIEHVKLDFETKEEEEFYRGIQGIIEHLIHKMKRDILSNTDKFVLLMRLRQLSVHPQTYINAMRRSDKEYDREDWSGVPTKVARLKKDLKDEVPKGHRFLVFCLFVDEMMLIREELEKDGHVVEIYYGGMNQEERTKALKAGADVLLIQIQAGGVGLNLQEFDRVIFMSPWWTSALIDQAIARTVRMGQKKLVKVQFYILAEEETDNIDKMMMEKADTKREILKEIFELAYNK
jgi:SNF2 family DNA or RNA helicase